MHLRRLCRVAGSRSAVQDNDLFRELFSNAQIALGIALPEGDILASNGKMAQMLGYAPDQLVGKNILHLYVHPEQREMLREALAESGSVRDFPVDLWHKDGGILHTIVDVTLLHLTDGPILLTVAKDIASLRTAVREIVSADMDSRQALARDIHDGLGQYLTALALRLHSLRKHAEDGEFVEASEIARAEEITDMAVRHAASLVRGLRPVEDRPDGFLTALAHLRDEVTKVLNVMCVVDCPERVTIGDHFKSVNLYYIVREAVHNAVKHGGASSVSVKVRRNGNRLSVSVRDNGAGIRCGKGSSGLGLMLMKKRAEMIGGRLVVESPSGGGTLVTCVLFDGRNTSGR